ncbi:LacI family DNA-binding transcriptional regulator [Herbiconiux daphne]|uniref:LacI family transcriptional regulator n=1 Tax=Herbiconiux daphne TaxID=2970914 RepID=A0ABT2H423_9MICO|nr:LacI family DNA-binding transcriptional regulator [Herbiconiux daphne]MCS5734659.1 LacI family transcriptional regulator [Herbiconiux daphne]
MPEIGIRDVAARAGVSVSTVSNALNRPELVSKRAAARVAEAIDLLGYVPNIAARQLRAGRSEAIGMAVINITNPFFSDLALGAEDAAEQAGYSVIVGNSYDHVDRERRYLDLFERQRLDGVLIAPVSESLELLERFRQRDVPVVLVDRVDPAGVYPSISLDDVLGGTMAATHLLENGCRHIAFIGGPLRVAQMRERLEGARATVEASGARFTFFGTETLNPQLGREIGDRISAMPPDDRPDGIFAGNDHVALGVLQSLISHGISIPGDVLIVGYDDIDYASTAVVPLTSVRQPSYEMGANAAKLLLEQLNPAGASTLQTRFVPELVPRQSTGH